VPEYRERTEARFQHRREFRARQALLEENDGAGNTFKATAKPVLIGTAVVGATTMIFSIIMALTNGLTDNVDQAVAAARSLRAGPDLGRRDHLLVHRRPRRP
jgi:K(+)-stimulated pyrophosphate-energized sodium pump